MKVACFSVAAMDYFTRKRAFFAGGNALNQAVRMSGLGADCAFVGALGEDDHGKRISQLLLAAGVDTSHVQYLAGVTANNRIINDETGERFGEENAWVGGVFEKFQIPEKSWNYLQHFDLWATHSSCPNFSASLLNKTDQFLCVDYLHLPNFKVLVDTIDAVDIAYVGGDPSMVQKLQELSEKTSAVLVLTLGAQGSLAFLRGETFKQAALAVEVVDTTGCGDAFQAGFSLEYFKNRNIPAALLAGAEQGKWAASHYGGVPWP